MPKTTYTTAMRAVDWVIPGFFLIVLLLFTYALLIAAPYPGFYFLPADGRVLAVFQPGNDRLRLEPGDLIKRIGTISIDDYQQNKRLNFYDGVQPGETIEIAVVRNGKSIVIPWVFPGFNQPEFKDRLFNIWWLAYVFWFIGMSTQLFMRPKDTQWHLFVAANYLTALFLMIGTVSSFRIWESIALLRFLAWLILPVYIHFHWIFPRSLRRIHSWLKVSFYLICFGVAITGLLLLAPGTSYYLAVLLAFMGSIVLLFLHYIFQPDHRHEVRLLAFAALIAMLPAIALSIMIASFAEIGWQIPQSAPLSLSALPILPGMYYYVLARGRLGGLELRTNRAISLYIFLVLLGIMLLLAVSVLEFINISREALFFDTIVLTLFTTFAGIAIFPSFQAGIERRLLGIKLPTSNMIENFSARIITSTTLSDLLKLLEEDVFPSLLVRQYAFVQVMDSSAKIILANNVDEDQVSREATLELLASSSTNILSLSNKPDQSLEWIRLRLPLKIGSDLIGVWLLGRRDPDDLYPQAELPILQSLANQTAVALSNILQTEQIRGMYEVNILRHEQERLRLARDLHDSVLNELAALAISADTPALPPKNQAMYEAVTQRLREIVSDLRPPMLNFGLKPAIDGLAENLMERAPGSVKIIANLQTDDECRYPETVEINLFRIAQEACQNALRYAHAKSIHMTGTIAPHTFDLMIVDDGIGFAADASLHLDEMLAKKHFGLANMLERANLIGAAIKIDSKPGSGTTIQVKWASKQSH